MNIQSIRFNGINRYPNSVDNNIGDCEELINIKSENGSLKICKDKKVISADIPYKKIIIHKIQNIENYIGFDDNGIIWFEPQSGDIKKRLYESSSDIDNIYINTISNMIVISDKNTVTNTVYLFIDGKYDLFINKDLLNIPLSITHLIHSFANSDGSNNISASFHHQFNFIGTREEKLKILQSTYNKILSDVQNLFEGYYLVGFNFSLWDNSETPLFNLEPFFAETDPNTDFNVGRKFPLVKVTGDIYYIDYYQLLHDHMIHITALQDIEKYKKHIKQINIYVSNPVKSIIFSDETIGSDFSTYTPLLIKESELEKQLLYKIGSINLSDTYKYFEGFGTFGSVISLKPGLNNFTVNKTLDVDGGLITRAGKMQVYNNRLHFFNSTVKVDLTNGIYAKSSDTLGVEYTADILIYLRNNNGEDLCLKYPNQTFYSTTTNEPYVTTLKRMIIVQDSRAYKIVFIRPNYYAELALTSSPRYNYAYAYPEKIEFIIGDKYNNVSTNDTYQELNTINVTAQNNPIHFPVEHSFSFDGKIMDIEYTTEPISQTQIGQYPLYIFTDNGIYSLQQGDGTVLYSNIILINSDDTSKSKDVCQTKNGIVYIANESIYILAGRNKLNISLPLKGMIDTNIRQNKSYQLCCMNEQLYNITDALSQVKLEEYLTNAKLSYSAPTDELFVCNNDYPYSYVFSFIHKAWHKVTECYEKISDKILRKFTPINNTSAIKAKGKIYITNAIIKASHQFYALHKIQFQQLTSNNELLGEFALIINNIQICAINIRYPSSLAIVIALLCKDIPYLDEYYDGSQYSIYSSMDLGTGATLKIINLSNNYKIIESEFTRATEGTITIPNKGIGESIKITSESHNNLGPSTAHSQTTRQITSADTVISIAEIVAETINAENEIFKVSANNTNNIINLSANTAGSKGNNISIDCGRNYYINTYVEPLSGGKDITLQPGNYGQLIDYSQDIDSIKTFHLQSKIITWPNAFTLINRTILSCKANLTPEQNLSMYLFASNNLKEWQCISGSQKQSATIDHIRLQRAAKAWKYFIIIIGGTVYSTTELSAITMDIRGQIGNKLR